ncbi:hypothetical protein D3C78_1531420 [compost metagenome]
MFHHQPTSIRAIATGIPAERRLAEQIAQYCDGLLHMLPFGRFIHMLIVDPAPTVADYVVIGVFNRFNHQRITR